MAKCRFLTEAKMHRFIIFIALLFWSQPAGAQNSGFEALQALGETHHHRFESSLLEQTYHVFVRLPEGYEQGEEYPAVYLLDGGWTYPLLAAYYHYLRFAEEVPTCIIVGISYGSDDWGEGNMRSRDYTAEAADRDYWGGAGVFQSVLRNEIIAFIEKRYPADPDRRVIFGHSLGGQFVLYSAQTAPGLFWGHIASNPALHRNSAFFLEALETDVEANAQPRLFVSSGSHDDPGFREPAMAWMKQWRQQQTLPWSLKTTTLEGHSHFSAAPEAFRQGMRWIFATQDAGD